MYLHSRVHGIYSPSEEADADDTKEYYTHMLGATAGVAVLVVIGLSFDQGLAVGGFTNGTFRSRDM